MIKAMIFDFGNVVYKTDWKKVCDLFLKKQGFNIELKNSEDNELIEICEPPHAKSMWHL